MSPGGTGAGTGTGTQGPTADLREAAAREAAAARELAQALRRAREAAQGRDGGALEAALGAARQASDELTRAGGRRTRLAAEAVRRVGYGAEASLSRVLDPTAAAELQKGLEAASREAAVLGLCVRYASSVAGHLAALARSGPCYDPAGRVGCGPRLAGRTA